MNLTIYSDIQSFVFRHGGNQDSIGDLHLSFKANNCAGFVDGKSVNICISPKATFENLINLFAVDMPCEFEDKTESGKIAAEAWAVIQRLRKI